MVTLNVLILEIIAPFYRIIAIRVRCDFPVKSSALPLLGSKRMVLTLLISSYEVYLSEVIGVGEGQSEKSHLLFWGQIAKMFSLLFLPPNWYSLAST